MGADIEVEANLAEPGTVTVAQRPRHWTDRLDWRIVLVATVIGFAAPVVIFLKTIANYSVNVIVQDQLTDVPLINASYHQWIPWAQLWAPYHEDRSFFPNLVTVFLAHTVHFNVQVEEYLGAALLIAAVAVVIVAHRRWSSDIPWLYYCPIALLILSPVQYETMLLGGVSWYLVLLALAGALAALDARSTTRWTIIAAVGCAVIGSFSALSGLMIWPVGLALLLLRRRPWTVVAIWLGSALATGIAYGAGFHGDSSSASHWGWVAAHPVQSARFLILLIGGTLGRTVGFAGYSTTLTMVFGFATLAVAGAAVVVYVRRPDRSTGAPIGLALILFGLLFACTVVGGRVVDGDWVTSAPRYTTYDLCILAGAYLAFLAPPAPKAVAQDLAAPAVAVAAKRASMVMRCLLLAMIAVQAWYGIPAGRVGGIVTNGYQEKALIVSRNFDHLPKQTVWYTLEPAFTPEYVLEQLAIARRLQLSEFSNWPSVKPHSG